MARETLSSHDVRLGNVRRAFGDRVRVFRLQRGLSQRQLAERAAMHRSYLGHIECGRATQGSRS